MSKRHWFLPDTPDVLGMLLEQATVTVEGFAALCAWADGDPAAADQVRMLEHEADAKKRDLTTALTVAFTTPVEPEDLFQLSRRLDEVLNRAKDTVREAELMKVVPDAAIATMAAHLECGVRHLSDALKALGHNNEDAMQAADAAVKQARQLEHDYRSAMLAVLELDDIREVTARRELYRRLSRTGDALIEVADRVWYAILKLG